MYIIAGAIPDDGGYYIERRIDPYHTSQLDQYHEFAEEDYTLFCGFLTELVQAGDKITICPVHYLGKSTE